MKDKICPLLSPVMITAYFAKTSYRPSEMSLDKVNLPICLRGDCQLWVPSRLGAVGYCGLISKVKYDSN